MHSRVIAGRYRLAEPLAAGAFGRVFRAVDALTKQDVAVKLLPPLEPAARERLRAEVSSLRLLRLPGIPRLLDEGEERGEPFIVMELAHGAPFPGDGPRDWESIRFTVVSLLESIARVHAAGVIHRDLKPANVLVDGDGRATVLDFGLSVGRAIGAGVESPGVTTGTPTYLAPEQLRGRPADVRADLYSVGVMIFEALTGTAPHVEGPRDEFVARRLERAAPALADVVPGVPGEVARVVDLLLAQRADDRPRSAAEALGRLRGEVDALRTTRDLPGLGGSGRTDALTEEELRTFFAGPERVFHLKSACARELWRRTQGDPKLVADTLEAWLRAGVAQWSGPELAVDPRILGELEEGLRVFPLTRPAAGKLPEDPELLALLAWLSIAWPNTDAELIERVAGIPAARVAALEADGAVLRDATGSLVCVVASGEIGSWSRAARRRAHAAIGRALPSGADGRLYHLVEGALVGEVSDEAVTLARRHALGGRLERAVAVLREGLLCLRRFRGGADELPILAQWVKTAMMFETPQALDQVAYELSRTASEDALRGRLEALVRAGLAAKEVDSERGRALADAVLPFEDVDLDRWRQVVRVHASRDLSIARQEELLAELYEWGRERGPELLRPHLALWEGRLRYRQARYEEAAHQNAIAAAGKRHLTQRLSAILNGGSARLETFEPLEALRQAEAALDLAVEARHPFFVARAEWLRRAALYRSGRADAPDLELCDALSRVGDLSQEGLVCLTEAAVAWRVGSDTADDLATRAARCWEALGHQVALLLTRALRAAIAGTVAPGEEGALAAEIATCPLPRIAAQAAGLLVHAGAPPRAEWSALAGEVSAGIPPEARSVRMDVLALDELEELLRQPAG